MDSRLWRSGAPDFFARFAHRTHEWSAERSAMKASAEAGAAVNSSNRDDVQSFSAYAPQRILATFRAHGRCCLRWQHGR
jgi:hypothetical protein